MGMSSGGVESQYFVGALSFAGASIIITKACRNEARYTFTLIHELGHLALGHVGIRINLRTGESVEGHQWSEDEANRFARHVLLPADEMRTFIDRRVPAVEIAKRKGVSFSAVMARIRTMHADGEFDEWATG